MIVQTPPTPGTVGHHRNSLPPQSIRKPDTDNIRILGVSIVPAASVSVARARTWRRPGCRRRSLVVQNITAGRPVGPTTIRAANARSERVAAGHSPS